MPADGAAFFAVVYLLTAHFLMHVTMTVWVVLLCALLGFLTFPAITLGLALLGIMWFCVVSFWTRGDTD